MLAAGMKTEPQRAGGLVIGIGRDQRKEISDIAGQRQFRAELNGSGRISVPLLDTLRLLQAKRNQADLRDRRGGLRSSCRQVRYSGRRLEYTASVEFADPANSRPFHGETDNAGREHLLGEGGIWTDRVVDGFIELLVHRWINGGQV